MKSLCDRFNRAIDSVVALVSFPRLASYDCQNQPVNVISGKGNFFTRSAFEQVSVERFAEAYFAANLQPGCHRPGQAKSI